MKKKFLCLFAIFVFCCSSIFTLSACGEEGNNAEPPHTHIYEETVTAPTCTERGFTTYTCACGDTFKADYVKAKGHTEVKDSGFLATCTTKGLSDGKHCSVCNKVIIEQRVVDVIAHSFTQEKVEEKYLKSSADCDDKAVYYKSCICGEKGGDEDIFEYGQALGHSNPDEMNICSICDEFCPITMSDREVLQASKIEKLSYMVNYFRDEGLFEISLGLKDKDGNLIKAPVCVSYFAVDTQGRVVGEGFVVLRENNFSSDSTAHIKLYETELDSIKGNIREVHFQVYNSGFYSFSVCEYSRLWSYDDLKKLLDIVDAANDYLALADDYYWDGRYDDGLWGNIYLGYAVDYTEKALPFLELAIEFANGKYDLAPSADEPKYATIQLWIEQLYLDCLAIVDADEYEFGVATDSLILCSDINMTILEYLSANAPQ